MKNLTPSEQLKAIIEFRKKNTAPVDTMGASKVGDKKDEKIYRFQTLIGLMLSSQTKDEVTSEAVKNLRNGIEGGLTPENLSQANVDTVDQLIKKVGFHKKKAENIIEAAKICQKDYDNDIPHSIDELTALKGVGMKMATLCMAHAWHEQVGIGVDVHVHRIANLLNWVKTNHPDKTEIELEKIFPKELWEPLNEAIVGFGQTICGSKKQKCELCPISDSCSRYNGIESDTESEDEANTTKKSTSKRSSKATAKNQSKKKGQNKSSPSKNKKSPKKKKSKRKSDEFEESDSDIEDFVVDDESEKEASESDFSESE
ncbi:alpha,alpha-trehalase nth1 [Tritrichomonas musculus]|uniref:Endonuclease III homolog n=1 Tax=Tritrichomonas musculus TaxID=1915356 RepID=A0ABR2KDW0_9EUKA